MYTVRLDNFEGPLDLLLFLVRKNEIDIQQIPVLLITQQYMGYLEIMKALNLDIAGEFLVMASTLLYLKSRALLPKIMDSEEATEEERTLEELKRQLLEYEQYREAAQRLKEQNILEKDVFARINLEVTGADLGGQELEEVSLFDLLSAFKGMLERSAEKEDIFEISVEEISVKDKIDEILDKLQHSQTALSFESLFGESRGRLVIVTTFLALLELIKVQAIRIYQSDNFARIYIYPIAVIPSVENATAQRLEP